MRDLRVPLNGLAEVWFTLNEHALAVVQVLVQGCAASDAGHEGEHIA